MVVLLLCCFFGGYSLTCIEEIVGLLFISDQFDKSMSSVTFLSGHIFSYFSFHKSMFRFSSVSVNCFG